ncbi:MAG TPA: arginine--tRNA ligase [Terracidiphilus sp.]|nr:arginine--tRNA ligase [Terracidiphilus sp.]
MYLELKDRLEARLKEVLQAKYDLAVESIPVETPPDLKMGELATPIALQLARTLRKAPKAIAQEIVEALGAVPGIASFELAGAGYINARLDRAAAAQSVAGGEGFAAVESRVHSLVEHTSINPNKAAHIGHLRNAILGDTFVRLLKAAGQRVTVQNYIDNTGVQVADVVVGFLHLEGKSAADVRALIAACEQSGAGAGNWACAFDYICWDLYARTSQWYASGTEEENAARKKLRYDTLHAIEHGGNETAEVAELISTAVLRRHLETMLRLGIEYDFLPRESEILHLNFWALAFEHLKQTGVLYFENEGKNKGCWVMTRPGAATAEGEVDEDAKVIVRSNGTVTYVGKDIAYHLWKFGLLGKDFGYKPFYTYPSHACWISTTENGAKHHPHFGGAQAIYNVIDARQSDPQANVIQALRGMGHTAEADHYTHFSYEMVALTPRCALELGYDVPEEDRSRAYIEVSGRKGFGVKADDLIDKLIAATLEEVNKRQTGRDQAERLLIARQIAIGALRYFMLKYTRNSVIAFDFKDALSFEGETGPYIQYAVVRARNIFRKAGTTPDTVLAEFAGVDAAPYLAGEDAEDIWAVWLRAGRRTAMLEQAIATSEPAYLAKHAFQLAQEFNNFYHKHHILTEEDAARRTLLLATAAVVLRELIAVLGWLGIESPEAM